ncbi:MAG: PDZ domain-containing protein [Cytophagales bacterium]|nr:PDZ domain-containing protein [Cytophagales bacterium]
MKKTLVLTALFFSLTLQLSAQNKLGFVMPADQNKVVIPFEQFNNLIVIPVIVNNFLKLKFVLDTGVETPILTEMAFAKILGIEFIREISISGPGIQDSVRAYLGQKVNVKLPGGVEGHNLNLLVLEKDYLNLSEKMGEEVYGIIGYDIFKQFIVDINYDENELTLYRPGKYKVRKKTSTYPLELIQSKPFVQATVMQGDAEDHTKLLIDTGASHALLLDDEELSVEISNDGIPTHLGTGLAGDIPGKLARIEEFHLSSFEFKNVIISVPDQDVYNMSIKRGSKHGTIGGEILSRLHPVFDYREGKLYLTKSLKYKFSFEFDMSGLTLVTKGKFLDSLMVDYIRPNSPAEKIEIKPGDMILSMNGYTIRSETLSTINAILKQKPGKKITIRLLRDGEKIKKVFRLKRAI